MAVNTALQNQYSNNIMLLVQQLKEGVASTCMDTFAIDWRAHPHLGLY